VRGAYEYAVHWYVTSTPANERFVSNGMPREYRTNTVRVLGL
jgi:hypothetical protein